MSISRPKVGFLIAFTSVFLIVGFHNCARVAFSPLNPQEAAAIGNGAFAYPATPGDGSGSPGEQMMSGVSDGFDSLIPTENLRIERISQINHWVQNCSKDKYETEKKWALAQAKADLSHKTIPVRYSVSLGKFIDPTALFAHSRGILREHKPTATDPDNKYLTPIYVGAPGDFNGYFGDAFYYITDHKDARQDYINGDKCFFNVVKVVGQVEHDNLKFTNYHYDPNGTNIENTADGHSGGVMYYGSDQYAAPDANGNLPNGAIDIVLSPRLFSRIQDEAYNRDNTKDPQIVPLYVADLREQQFKLNPAEGTAIRAGFSNSAIRRMEYEKSFKEELDLPKIFQNYYRFVWNFSHSQSLYYCPQNSGNPEADCVNNKSASFDFSGIVGAPQLFHNIMLIGLDGVFTSTLYTPIVLDLGERQIRTSSMTWGSFFNFAGITIKNETDPIKKYSVSHSTAWLGGALVDAEPNHDDSYGDYFELDVRRQADDGFLVMPEYAAADIRHEHPLVTSSKNLFGNKLVVNGLTYDNGFEALRALTGKSGNDCLGTTAIEKRYFGPWDGDNYNKIVKVWVDANRNGVVDPGEMKSLAEAGVFAMNTCRYGDWPAIDKFGNGTKLRTAFIYAQPGDNNSRLTDNSPASNAELKTRITTGKRGDGEPAEFRVAIDIYFQGSPQTTLTNIDDSDLDTPALLPAPTI